MKELWASKLSVKRNKTNAYISLVGLLVGLYMIYSVGVSYVSYEIIDTSFLDFISDRFADRLLLLIMAIVSIAAFIYYWSKKSLIYETRYDIYVELLKDQNKCIKKTKQIKIKYLKGKKTILEEKLTKTDFISNMSELVAFREEKVHHHSKSERVELTIEGSNTIGDQFGTPLNLATTKSNHIYYRIFAVYSDKTEILIEQGGHRQLKFETFFKEFIRK